MHGMETVSLFDLMVQVGTLLQAPIVVPLFFGMFIRKVPDWAAWATVVFGLLVSWVISNIFTASDVANLLHMTPTDRELHDLSAMWNIFSHLVFTGGFFVMTRLFWRPPVAERQKAINAFYRNMETPVIADADQDVFDSLQRDKIGKISMLMGAGLLLLILVPNPLWGRVLFLLCALTIVLFGWMLQRSAVKGHPPQRKETPLTQPRH
jgi:hypothetical protein